MRASFLDAEKEGGVEDCGRVKQLQSRNWAVGPVFSVYMKTGWFYSLSRYLPFLLHLQREGRQCDREWNQACWARAREVEENSEWDLLWKPGEGRISRQEMWRSVQIAVERSNKAPRVTDFATHRGALMRIPDDCCWALLGVSRLCYTAFCSPHTLPRDS